MPPIWYSNNVSVFPRRCLGCEGDISAAHPRRQRCVPCATARNAEMSRASNQRRHQAYGARRWPLTCAGCAKAFTSPSRKQKYCSHSCSKSIRTVKVCVVCSSEFKTYAANPARFCSTSCRGWAAFNGARAFVPPSGCAWCARPVVDRNRKAIYCSDRCMRTAAQGRRTAKGAGNAHRDRVLALHVFERDQWICHICMQLIDKAVRGGPLMPSLDHLIPIAHPEYPGHLTYNLAAAHLRCNSLRRDTIAEADRRLYEELARRYEVGEIVAPPVTERHRRTHCSQGHPFDPDESYLGGRYCRECNRSRSLQNWRAQQVERVAAGGRLRRRPDDDRCAHGHLMTPENTYVAPATGWTSCLECRREVGRRTALRRRAAKLAAK